MLAIWLELCLRHRIDEVLLNLHAHADQVRSFLECHDYKAKVTVSHEPTLLGSAGTLAANRAWLGQDPQFWIFYADVLTNMDLDRMMSAHLRSGMIATLGLYRVPNPTQCGIAQVDENGVIREFHEKPTAPVDNLAFSGVMIARSDLLNHVPSRLPADMGKDVLPTLCGRMSAYEVTEYLIDIGTMPRYEYANRTWRGMAAWNAAPC
jgi:mannose-1-phosphate guanylyltransferase